MGWDGFGIPGQVRKVVSGIGSIYRKDFDLDEKIKLCNEKLFKSTPVMQVLSLPGWKLMCTEYNNLIEVQKATISFLAQNAKENIKEIQRRRDLQFACELWLQAMQAKRIRHDETANELNHLQREAQNARPA